MIAVLAATWSLHDYGVMTVVMMGIFVCGIWAGISLRR
jgi:hypothetical protein